MSHEHNPVKTPNLLEQIRGGAMRYVALGASALALGGAAALEASAPAQAIVRTGDFPTTPAPTSPESTTPTDAFKPAPVGLGDKATPLSGSNSVKIITDQKTYDKQTKKLERCNNGKKPTFLRAEAGLDRKARSEIEPGIARLVVSNVINPDDYPTIKLTVRKGHKFNGGVVMTSNNNAYILPRPNFKPGKKWVSPYPNSSPNSVGSVSIFVC